jgi:hypothetical protein
VAVAARARNFASQHAFEKTFVSRIQHVIRNSRLPENLKAQVSQGAPVVCPLKSGPP